MAIRWPITSTASMAPLWVFAHRAIWLRLFPMRETCRVRSRSTSAAGAAHVRVRAIARRISADRGTPAAAALARQSANSAADTRAGDDGGAALRHHAAPTWGKGGGAPIRNLHGSATCGGSKGGREPPPRQPRCMTTGRPGSPALRASDKPVADGVAEHPRERSGEPAPTGLAKRGWRWDGG